VRKIAVLTSGGDAAGMNAAIRAVTRTALHEGAEVFGVRYGFAGLVEGDFIPLGQRDVGNVLHQGGTFLGSARLPELHEIAVQERAIARMREREIEGLVVIGGNGSQAGAHAFDRLGFPVVGVASTIDNDLVGSDPTIGVDTALNVALEAVDKLRVTASSHRRASLIEVMGRKCGYLALMVGIAGGADAIVIPEVETPFDEVAEAVRAAHGRGKAHALVVVAEGARLSTEILSHRLAAEVGSELRTTVLGHIQRGGTPTVADRLLGTRLGAAAAHRLLAGEHGLLVGIDHGEVTTTKHAALDAMSKPLDLELLALARVLAS
jgi:6-phosphofructokinase 1